MLATSDFWVEALVENRAGIFDVSEKTVLWNKESFGAGSSDSRGRSSESRAPTLNFR